MDLDEYRRLLLAKEKELLADLGEARAVAVEDASPEVEDEMDAVVRSEAHEVQLIRGNQEYETLRQVRDALSRIDDGTYGFCAFCGRPIDEKRLRAVPWALYDLQHQEEADRIEQQPRGGSTL